MAFAHRYGVPIATGQIVYSEETARKALQLAGVSTSDSTLSKTPSAQYELKSPKGQTIAKVTSGGYVTVYR